MPSSMQLLRNSFVRTILISNLFSQIGIWIRNFAILLFVMEKTNGDAIAVAMISVAEYAPIFVFSFIGGVFSDRWRPKKTILWCEYLSALSVFIVFFILDTGSWGGVFFATLCSSILSQFAVPSGMKLFKLHMNDADAPICMSLLQTLFSIFMVLGPVLGTFVYQQSGIELAILLTGISFVLSALALLFIPADPKQSSGYVADPRSLLHEMVDGIRYVMVKKELLLLSLCFMLVGLGVGLISPLSIFLVTERLDLPVQYLQWITIPYGMGEVIGGIITFGLAAKITPKHFLIAGLLVNGAGIILTGLSNALWLTMAAQFAVALLQPAIYMGNNALVMQHTEHAYIGRVTGIRTPLMTGSMLLMMSLAGLLKESFSLGVVYGLAGLCFIAGLMILLLPSDLRKNSKISAY